MENSPEHKGSANRYLGPVSTKPSTYLSNFIIYIATIGDIVDGTDTTHDFNYFSLVYEWPKDVSSILYHLFDVFFSCIHTLNENQHIHKFKLISNGFKCISFIRMAKRCKLKSVPSI